MDKFEKAVHYGLLALLAAALAAGVMSAAIAETTVGVHLGSQHIDADAKYNNFNPGAYVVHSGWTAGGYYNSIKKASFYAGYTFEYPVGPGSLGLTVGGITGYRSGVAPLVAPSYAVPIGKDYRARLFYLPKVDFTGAHVLHLTLERKF